jgi:hypothetical protein
MSISYNLLRLRVTIDSTTMELMGIKIAAATGVIQPTLAAATQIKL